MKKPVPVIILFCIALSFFMPGKSQNHDAWKIRKKGYSFYSEKEYTRALENFEQSLEMEKKAGKPDNDSISATETAIAACYQNTGNYDKAIALFDKQVEYLSSREKPDKLVSLFARISACCDSIRSKDYPLPFDTTKLENKNAYFIISDILKQDGSVFTVRISGGKNNGIINSTLGIAYCLYSDNSERNGTIGVAHVKQVKNNSSLVEIAVKDTLNYGTWPQPGDLILFGVNIPRLEYRSIFFELASQQVDLVSSSNKRWYSLLYLMKYDRPALEQAMLKAIAYDTRKSYETVIKDTAKYYYCFKPSAQGWYKGKPAAEVMKTAGSHDIAMFLDFVNKFSLSYMGYRYYSHLAFAFWIFFDTQLTATSVMDSMLNAKDDIKLLTLFDLCKHDYDSVKMIDSWISQARKSVSDGQPGKAQVIYRNALAYSEYMDDKEHIYSVLCSMGKSFKEMKDTRQAIDNYQKAESKSLTLNNYSNAADCEYNMALCEVEAGNYEKAEQHLKKSEEYQYEIKIKDENYYESLISDYWEEAYVFDRSQKYAESRRLYKKAISCYDSSPLVQSNDKILLYKSLGLSFASTLEYDSSEFYFRKESEEALRLNDFSHAANAWYNMEKNYTDRFQYEKGLQYLITAEQFQSRDQYRDTVWYKAMASMEWQKGFLQDKLNFYSEALKSYKNGLSYFDSSQTQSPDRIVLMTNTALLLKKLKQNDSSLVYHTRAYHEAIKLNNFIMAAENKYSISRIYTDQTKYGEGYQMLQEAMTELNKIKIHDSTYYKDFSDIYWQTGYVLDETDQNIGSRNAYEKAIQYSDSANNKTSDIAVILNNLGLNYRKTGDYKISNSYFLKSSKLYSDLKFTKGVADETDNLAYNFFTTGNYDSALYYYKDAYNKHCLVNDKKGARISKSSIGQALWNKNDYAGAIKEHEEAIRIATEDHDTAGLAYSYQKIGGLYKESGEPVKAKDYFMKSFELLKNVQDTTQIASLYEDFGDFYYSLKDYTGAIKYYKFALELRKKLNVRYDIAETLYWLSYSCYYMQDYLNSVEFLNKCIQIRRDIKDKEGEMNCMLLLAYIDQYINVDYGTAEKYSNQALSIARTIDSKLNIANCFIGLSNLYSSKGDPRRSDQYLDSAMFIYQSTANKSGLCDVFNNKGIICISQGNFDKALDYYNQSLKLAEEINVNFKIACSYIYMSEYYYLTGNFKKALDCGNQSLELNKKAENQWGMSNAYIVLGNTYNHMGIYKTAIECYHMSDSIEQLLGDALGQATPVNNTGTIYFYQGEYSDALIQFYNVHELLRKINYEGEMMIIAKSNIGEVYYEEGLYHESEKWLYEALNLAKKTDNKRKIPDICNTLGELKLAEGNYDEADSFLRTGYNKSAEYGEKTVMIGSATNLGRLYFEKNEPDSARKYLQVSVELSDKTGSNKLLWEPLYLFGQLSARENKVDEEISYLEKSVDIIEDIKGKLTGGATALKSFSKSDSKLQIYETLVSELTKQNRIKEAFYYQEKANIEGLKEQTRGGDLRGTRNLTEDNSVQNLELKVSGIYDELVKEKSKPDVQQNADKIKVLEQRMTVAKKNYHSFVDSIVHTPGNIAQNFSSNINPDDLEHARLRLPDDVAVIEFLNTPGQLIIFVATKTKLSAKVIDISKDDMDKFISQFYNEIILRKDLATVKKNSEQLYNLLIAPIWDEIKDKTKLAMVPTGKLFKVPFQALGKTQADNSFRYMIEDFSIYYINNIDYIVPVNNDMEIKILAFGNPDKTLPNATIEVNNIKAIFENSSVYVEEAASKDIAKTQMANYTVVHFATHGNLDPVIFKNSYLTLAPNKSKGEDGRFTIEEIWALDDLPNCQLITLSACNTAVNDDKIEGWINNPAKEFIKKGARSVVASLWMVDDASTSELMQQFYVNLRDKKSKADALKSSQVKLLHEEKFSHPFFWAAFELIGDWK